MLYDKEKELKNCTFIKTVLMISVVLYHAMLYGNNHVFFTGSNEPISMGIHFMKELMSTMHTRTFMIISGYLFFYLREEKGKYRSFFPFIGNKALRLVVPYFVIGTVLVGTVNVLIGKIPLLDEIKNIYLSLDCDQLWFLLCLFWEFVLFYFAFDFVKKHDVASFIIAFILAIVGYVGKSYVFGIFQLFNSLMYAVFFLMGMKFRQHGSAFFRKRKGVLSLLILVLYTASFMLRQSDEKVFSLLGDGLFALSYQIAPPVCFCWMQALADRVNVDAPFWQFLGKHSFTIYMLHQQIIYLLLLAGFNRLNVYVSVFLSFLGAFVLSLLLSMLLHIWNPTRVLIGEKPVKRIKSDA